MAYLKEKGISSSYHDYRRLPWGVMEDVRILYEGEALDRQRKEGGSGKR